MNLGTSVHSFRTCTSSRTSWWGTTSFWRWRSGLWSAASRPWKRPGSWSRPGPGLEIPRSFYRTRPRSSEWSWSWSTKRHRSWSPRRCWPWPPSPAPAAWARVSSTSGSRMWSRPWPIFQVRKKHNIRWQLLLESVCLCWNQISKLFKFSVSFGNKLWAY